jgi:DNA-binding MarR family transcriptional regulator
MAENDELPELKGIFSAPQRMTIMFLLYLHRRVKFKDMQKLLNLTPGNLDHHVRKLKQTGYVKTRYLLSWRPLVVIEMTERGAEAFRDYAVRLRKLLERIE